MNVFVTENQRGQLSFSLRGCASFSLPKPAKHWLMGMLEARDRRSVDSNNPQVAYSDYDVRDLKSQRYILQMAWAENEWVSKTYDFLQDERETCELSILTKLESINVLLK